MQMDKLALKRRLRDECINRHKQTAQTYIAAMSEAQQSANEYGNPEDWFDTYKSDLLNSRDRLSQQLQKILDEIKTLEKIDVSKESETVSFGSVVMTKEQKMFISTGMGKVELDKEIYYAVSPSVPIYNAMRDKKKGETFEFRGKKTVILDVF
jgi:hypothetical protein